MHRPVTPKDLHEYYGVLEVLSLEITVDVSQIRLSLLPWHAAVWRGLATQQWLIKLAFNLFFISYFIFLVYPATAARRRNSTFVSPRLYLLFLLNTKHQVINLTEMAFEIRELW